jgi:hypothetical protein
MNDNKVTPQTYAAAFIHNPAGAAILEVLHRLYYDTDAFDADPYVHARNAGRRDVVRHILIKLGQAENPPQLEEGNEPQ